MSRGRWIATIVAVLLVGILVIRFVQAVKEHVGVDRAKKAQRELSMREAEDRSESQTQTISR